MSILKVDTIQDTSGDLNPTLVSATSQATTSGTAFDFTGVPAGVTRITMSFDQVSLSGTDSLLVQIGDSGGIETTGYVSASNGFNIVPEHGNVNSTTGFAARLGLGADAAVGHMVFTLITGTTWVASHVTRNNTTTVHMGAGVKALTGVLTQIRLTRDGTDTFDAGSVNILYE